MAGPLKNYIGETFGMLTIIGPYERRKCNTYWRCKCQCGALLYVYAGSLNVGKTSSCGCVIGLAPNRYQSVHGRRPLDILASMKIRCYSESNRDYPNYGGRGIYICDEWLMDSKVFCTWYDKHYEDGKSIDRKDNDGPYSPDNCRFVSRQTQACNRRPVPNPTGYTGVQQCSNQWKAQARVNGKQLYLGLFSSPIEANAAYTAAIMQRK